MEIKVWDKSDSFDVKLELSRKFIVDNIDTREIKLNKHKHDFIMKKQNEYISVNDEIGFYSCPEEVLLEYGIISQYQ